jgi:hypothetical protein
MPFGQKPTFFFNLLKKNEKIYIVIEDKKRVFDHSGFYLQMRAQGCIIEP